MRNYVKILSIALLISLVIILIFKGIGWLGTGFGPEFWQGVGYILSYSLVLTFLNSLFFDYLNHKVRWKKYARFRVLIGAAGSIVLTMVGILAVRICIEMGLKGEGLDEFIAGERFAYYLIALVITMAFSTLFHAVYFYKHWQDSKVKEQKIIAGTASAKFDALKNQLDPHFLFNSLNVLTSLIDEDPYQAQKFTTSLSKVYRYVLEQKNKDLVTLEEELQFARTYVRLLKMRFEDSIVFEIPDQVNNPEALIVPLSLQLLLENAVKHNTVTPSSPLHIKVFEREGMLVVGNNLQQKEVLRGGSGVGLINIQQRYSLLTDRKVGIYKTREAFEVELPLLTKQISIMHTQETYIEEKRYQKAKERVEAIKGFYGNLLAYCLVIPFLAWLNFRTTDFPWAIFPTVGWGFGLLMHGWEVFGYNPLWGKRWEEKKIRELMEKEDF